MISVVEQLRKQMNEWLISNFVLRTDGCCMTYQLSISQCSQCTANAISSNTIFIRTTWLSSSVRHHKSPMWLILICALNNIYFFCIGSLFFFFYFCLQPHNWRSNPFVISSFGREAALCSVSGKVHVHRHRSKCSKHRNWLTCVVSVCSLSPLWSLLLLFWCLFAFFCFCASMVCIW